MKMVLRAAALIIVFAALYYFFFLPYEFQVNFSSRTLPGDVIQTIRIWDRSLDSARIVEVDSFNRVEQRVFWEGREYVYDWRFRSSDSITYVKVRISEPGNKLRNKLMVLIGEPPIEKSSGFLMKQFYDVLKYHLNLTKVKVIGPEEHGSEFCLCRSIEKKQFDKGRGMMENYMPMSSFIVKNGLKLAGLPSVHVNQWSHSRDKLKYEFCFPILETDSLPVIDGLEYRRFKSFRGIKAEYTGNFITSDRAWYVLHDFATKSGYKISGLPIEYFIDNPNFGAKDTEWRAEIFLPVE